jgi:hypothetical protein
MQYETLHNRRFAGFKPLVPINNALRSGEKLLKKQQEESLGF